MAINFNTTIDTFAQTQKTVRAKNFMEFTSKKKLQESGEVTEAQFAIIDKVKGTFSLALHKDKKYMVITIYRANTEQKYQFVILDINTGACATADSVKVAKQMVLEQVAEEAKTADTQQEAPSTDAEEDKNPETKKGRRSSKNAETK